MTRSAHFQSRYCCECGDPDGVVDSCMDPGPLREDACLKQLKEQFLQDVTVFNVLQKWLTIQLLCHGIPNSKTSASSDVFEVAVDFGNAQLYTSFFFVCLTATLA